MYQRGPFCLGFIDGRDKRKNFVFNLDQISGLFSFLSSFCNDEGNGVPKESCGLSHSNHRFPILYQVAYGLLSRNILSCEYPYYSLRLLCLGLIYG